MVRGMHDDALTLAEALLYLRRFVSCAVEPQIGNGLAPDGGCASFERLVAQGHAEATGGGYRITTSGDRLGKAVLQHVQACTGTFERARPDGCMERLCCPRCGGDLDLLQRGES
jgi:hypothetical protein